MFIRPEYQVGDTITIQKRITDEDAALTYGSGELTNMLATPSLVALMIEASSRLIDSRLQDEYTSAGLQVSVTHLNPSPIGNTVSMKVTIREIQGNHIILDMEAYDEMGEIGTGNHERVIVNKEGIKAKAVSRIFGR